MQSPSPALGRARNTSSVAPLSATECSRLRTCGGRSLGGEGPGGPRRRPPDWALWSVFNRVLMGSLARVEAGQVGEAGRGWGWGELPRSPGGSPAQIPGLLVTVCVAVAVADRAGGTRPMSVRRLGPRVRSAALCHPPVTPTATATGRPAIVRGRPRCANAPYAQVRESRTVHGRNPSALYLPRPLSRGSGPGRGRVYPRYRAGQGPLPGGSTRVAAPRYPARDPRCPYRVRPATPHLTWVTQLGVNRGYSAR